MVPVTLFFSFTSAGFPFGPYTLTWQPRPAGLLGPDPGWYTNAFILDVISGNHYEWNLGCSGSIWSIGQDFYGSSGPVLLDSWSIGVSGNTCSPFLLSNDQGHGGGAGIDTGSAMVHP